jgi:hypothetical protein
MDSYLHCCIQPSPIYSGLPTWYYFLKHDPFPVQYFNFNSIGVLARWFKLYQ